MPEKNTQKRSIKEWILRYFIFFLGLTLVSFGVAFSKKSGLGTTPISVIPNVLSEVLPVLSIGNWTILFSLLLIFLQIPILKGKVNYFEVVLEVVISLIFGYLIDFALFLVSAVPVETAPYIVRLAVVVLSCVCVGLGAYFQITGGVVMLPGDAFCRAVATAVNKKYSTIRTVSDLSFTTIAAIVSLSVPPHGLIGVREGTVIACLLVGNSVKLFAFLLRPLKQKLLPEGKKTDE